MHELCMHKSCESFYANHMLISQYASHPCQSAFQTSFHSLTAIGPCQVPNGYDPHVIQAKQCSAMQCNAILLPSQSSNSMSCNRCNPRTCFSEFPIFLHRLDCPIEFLPQRLGEELFNGHVKFLGKDHGKTRIDIILRAPVSATPNMKRRKHSQS